MQSTGVGGPSLIAVLSDLADIGVTRAVRIGLAVSSSGTDPLVVAAGAVQLDGASRSLSPELPLRADDALASRFADAWKNEFGPQAAPPTARVASRDAHDHERGGMQSSSEAEVSDLSTASLYAIGQNRGLSTLSLLLSREPGDADPHRSRAGRLAARTLAD